MNRRNEGSRRQQINTHPNKRMSSLSLRQAISSFVGSTLCEFDLLAEVTVPFPVEILAPGRAVEDEMAPQAMMDVGIRVALSARTLVSGLQRRFVQFGRR